MSNHFEIGRRGREEERREDNEEREVGLREKEERGGGRGERRGKRREEGEQEMRNGMRTIMNKVGYRDIAMMIAC